MDVDPIEELLLEHRKTQSELSCLKEISAQVRAAVSLSFCELIVVFAARARVSDRFNI